MTRAMPADAQRSRARVVLSTSALLAAWLATGCSSQPAHGAPAGGCPTDAQCIGIGGGPGGGTTDSGTTVDSSTGDAAEVGVVDIHAGEVRALDSFLRDPATGVLDTETNLVVKGAIGAKFLDATVLGGNFTLTGLDNTFPVNFVYLESRATTPIVTRTIFGLPVAATGGAYDIVVPTFPANASDTLALAAGIPLPSGTARGTATVVVQVFDSATGAPLKGVTGAPTPAAPQPSTNANPYYDDGSDGVVVSATGTSSRGTIVWLPVTPGFLAVSLKHGTTTYPTFNAPTMADAVTFVRLGVVP
jgi:hypothetical protein